MTAGATHIQDPVLGLISQGITTPKRLDTEVEAALMAGIEAKIMTAVDGINKQKPPH